jgi:hypothetical protein
MIPPTSIDGTDITGATIDGTDVTEITVDGQTVFTAVPPSGVARFEFEQDFTDSWGSFNGTNNGATFTSNSAIGNSALSFDGNDYVDISGKPLPEDMTKPWSVSLYVQDSDPYAQSETNLIQQSDDGSNDFNGWFIRFESAGRIVIGNRDGKSDWYSRFNLPASTFSTYANLIFTYDGSENPSNSRLYVDGGSAQSPDDTVNQGASGIITNIDMDIGAREGNPGFLTGKLDDIRIYDKELTSTEASDLYNNGSI